VQSNFYQLEAEDMPWTCHPQRGVSYKSLRYGHADKSGAVLIHMCPGTTYPAYRADAGQDVFIVDGELMLDGQTMRRGAYLHIEAGSVQAPTTERGCVLFVSFPGNVQHI
jgi:hypothetical protein